MNNLTWLIGLLALSAFFAAVETAFTSLSSMKVVRLIDENKKISKIIKKIKDKEHRFLITILICNNLVNIAAASIAAVVATSAFGSRGIGIATGVMTFIILVFGEITPKTIAIRNAENIVKITAWPVHILMIVLYPLALFFDIITKGISRSFGLIERKRPEFSEDELVSAVRASEKEGSITPIEKEIVTKVFNFDRVQVREIMTARTDMVAVNIENKLKDVIDFVISTGHSRIPVYKKKHDHIVGIIYIKDIVKSLKENRLDVPLENLVRPAYFVPETKMIDTLLSQFQKKKIQMAVVVDEHGGVSGLVTFEDVLEEIVGEIYDVTDRHEPIIKKISEKEYLVQARASIDDVNKELEKAGINIEDREHYDTLGGFVLPELGKIPKPGEKLELDGFTLVVDNVVKQRILSLKIVLH